MKLKGPFVSLFLAGVFLTSCGPKPYYQTNEGRKKQKYYNEIQFSGKSSADMKAPKSKTKSKKKK